MSDYIQQQNELEKNLPKISLNAILGDKAVVDITREIGDTYELSLDQLGTIYEGINQMLAGKLSSSNFKNHLRTSIDEYDLPNSDMDKLITDLNTKIFLPLREVMKQKIIDTPKQEETIEDSENPSREDILAGIENPVLHTEKVTVTQTPQPNPLPITTPIVSAPELENKVPFKTEPQAPITTIEIEPEMGLMEQKLAGAVKMPVQEVKVTAKTPERSPLIEQKPNIPNTPRPAQRTYTTDPYREPPTA